MKLFNFVFLHISIRIEIAQLDRDGIVFNQVSNIEPSKKFTKATLATWQLNTDHIL